MVLNTVHQHNCFIIQGSYIGYMFRVIDQSSSGLFSRLSHKVLCTHWDPSVCTSIKYIKQISCLRKCDNNIYLLQLGCHPVAVVILHVYKT